VYFNALNKSKRLLSGAMALVLMLTLLTVGCGKKGDPKIPSQSSHHRSEAFI
jgi:predicted small lipoprotein YifL